MTKNSALSTIANLNCGAEAIISSLTKTNSDVFTKLKDMGVDVGSNVKILHFGSFGKDPIAVKFDNITIALRRSEANQIAVC